MTPAYQAGISTNNVEPVGSQRALLIGMFFNFPFLFFFVCLLIFCLADLIKLAKEEYYEETRKLFTFDSTWSILRTHKKWQEALTSKRKKSINVDESMLVSQSVAPSTRVNPKLNVNMITSSNHLEETHPMGVKQAKQKGSKMTLSKKRLKILEKNANENVRRGAAFAHANILQEESNQIQKSDAQVKAQQLEMLIILALLTEKLAKEYFLLEKNVRFF
ncbi:uncharacterized protein VP01_1370g7 [Puccinia sorghi]|uniref:No apical meristem-associated C-terminal domain-containing protein n=1 Tax=Puccinia sorghi TaxID=27349 RepID=A0A0L6VLV4_9BASI|nr:uncharacterized protein VP01_1370g7 [Puccinia sorghi]